jgi:hypothetical protein
MHDLVVLVPMLGRPEGMPTVRDTLHDTTPNAGIVWLITDGDTEVRAAVRQPSERRLVFPPRKRGDYAHKLNTAIAWVGGPLIFLGAGDIAFRPGWWEACLAKLTPGIGVVGTNDLGNPRTADGRLSTHSLVTREYCEWGSIDRPGQLLHEGYWHEFVDDELCETAKHRRAWAHAPDAHVEHLHPDHGKRPADALDAQRQARMRQGQRLFTARRHLWT